MPAVDGTAVETEIRRWKGDPSPDDFRTEAERWQRVDERGETQRSVAQLTCLTRQRSPRLARSIFVSRDMRRREPAARGEQRIVVVPVYMHLNHHGLGEPDAQRDEEQELARTAIHTQRMQQE